MTMHLPADVAAKIERMVEKGYQRTPEDALRMAVTLLVEHQRRLDWLRAAIAETDAQVERGEFSIMTPELMDEIEAEVEERFLRGDMPSPDVCP